jgi:methionyl-tRNA formyltransferase
MDSVDYIFFGATKFSEELLIFLIKHDFSPKAIFAIPKEFSISYNDKKVINSNYANLKKIAE